MLSFGHGGRRFVLETTATDRDRDEGDSEEELTASSMTRPGKPETDRSSGNHQRDVAAVGEDDGDAEPMGYPGSGSSVETKETTARRILNILLGAREDSGLGIDGVHGDGGLRLVQWLDSGDEEWQRGTRRSSSLSPCKWRR